MRMMMPMSKRSLLPTLAGTLLLALLVAGTSASPAPAPVEITVSAAASLRHAFDELVLAFQRQNPRIKVTLNFGASGALQRQIEHGAPVDVFASAASAPVDALEKSGMLQAGSRWVFASNRLALVVPRDVTQVKGFTDLAKPGVKRIALGEPQSVPVGTYAREALQHLGTWDAVKDKAVYAKDVVQVLAYVESGHVDAGVVYATDAATARNATLVELAPESLHAPITYPLAIIKDCKHPAEARLFTDFLLGKQGQQILARHGFLSPPTPAR